MSKKVVLAGGGNLGSQIAFQSAFNDFDVTIWLRSEDSIKRAIPRVETLYKTYLAEVENLDKIKGTNSFNYPRGFVDNALDLTDADIADLKDRVKRAFENIKYETDLKKASENAYIIIEAVAEKLDQKKDFYDKLSEVVEDDTIIVTNTSTFLPSQFKDNVKDNSRYLALHFANKIWRNNTGEVMGHEETSQEKFDEVVKFAKDIKMVPLVVKKEVHGYLLNSLLVPLLNAAEGLWAEDVADIEDIDRAWELGTGAPFGPFKILDVIGLTTAYNVVTNMPGSDDPSTTVGKIAKNLKKYLDEGKIGVESGEGFYKYK